MQEERVMLIKCSTIFQVHHGQPGGDVHGAADAVQQDVRDGPQQKDERAGSTELTQCPLWTTPVSIVIFLCLLNTTI